MSVFTTLKLAHISQKLVRSPGDFISQLRRVPEDGTASILGDPTRFSISMEHSVTIKQILKPVNLERDELLLFISL